MSDRRLGYCKQPSFISNTRGILMNKKVPAGAEPGGRTPFICQISLKFTVTIFKIGKIFLIDVNFTVKRPGPLFPQILIRP
jgi:hypothetical protein